MGQLIVKIYDKNGKLRKKIVQKDIGTTWFAQILKALFSYTTKGTAEIATITNEDGIKENIEIKSASLTGGWLSTYYCDVGSMIAVGKSSTEELRNQYALLDEVKRATATVTIDPVENFISITADITFDQDTDVYEVGLLFKFAPNGHAVLLDRTVLGWPTPTPEKVLKGETASFEYRIFLE